jgi:hypothetical protein
MINQLITTIQKTNTNLFFDFITNENLFINIPKSNDIEINDNLSSKLWLVEGYPTVNFIEK